MSVEEIIEQDWPNQPLVKAACLAILHGLKHGKLLDHYTFGLLHQFAKDADDGTIAQAVMYLCASKIGALQTSIVYEVNGLFLSASGVEQESYAKGEPIVHPVSGLPMRDQDLFVVFIPGPLLLEGGA